MHILQLRGFLFGISLISLFVAGIACNTSNGISDNPQPTGGNDPVTPSRVLSSSSDNLEVIRGTVEIAEQMLSTGESVDNINQAILDELLNQNKVADAKIDTTSGFVTVHFEDGEFQSFEIVASESTDGLEELQPDVAAPETTSKAISSPESSSAIETVFADLPIPGFDLTKDYRSFRIPASSLALHANALSHFHPEWPANSATDVIHNMLESRGYTVTQEPLTLQHLRDLHKYGIILIETHGLWRENSIYTDLAFCQDPITAEHSVPNCGGDNSLNALLTTTTTADEPIANHKNDLETGRLYLHNVTRTQEVNGEVKPVTTQYYAATANFVRQYSTPEWSENAIFILNACQGYRANDDLSPWAELVEDKAEDGIFLGWDKKLKYGYAAKAALNLFQLLTMSNEEVVINGITLLEKKSPPVGMRSELNAAFTELEQSGILTSKRGAKLKRRVGSQEGFDYLLMPKIHKWEAPDYTEDLNSREGHLYMWTEPGTTVHIGTDEVQVSPFMLCCSDQWTTQDSPTMYGTIRAEWKNRISTPRTVHIWKPQITVKGSSGAMKFNVQVHLQGRASMNNWGYRDTIKDDAPPPQFTLNWEPKGSAYSWNVSGQTTSDGIRYEYKGSGSKTFTENDSGYMETTEDGQSVRIRAYVGITYNITETDLDTGDVTTYQQNSTISIEQDITKLSKNWTVLSARYTADVGPGTATVSWPEFPADPPFDYENTPR